jgi:hypothetical protein
VSHAYCPECGFQNPESANFCARCGAAVIPPDEAETTMTFTPDEGDDALHEALDDVGIKGPALVVRSGGGRSGETFGLDGESTTIGRSPDCGIFLDDVTVSRKHAVVAQRDGHFQIEDQGSLNGTFVNRKRVESAELDDGDEIQIGKYRMTFLLR